MLGLGPGFARPEQHPSDAGGFEIVVHPCVGRDEELRARVGPHLAVVLRDERRRVAFGDVEAQHQPVARMEHPEADFRG